MLLKNVPVPILYPRSVLKMGCKYHYCLYSFYLNVSELYKTYKNASVQNMFHTDYLSNYLTLTKPFSIKINFVYLVV